MSKVLFLAPTGPGVGLTSIAVGLVRALDQRGVKVAFCKPVAQVDTANGNRDRSVAIIESTTHLHPPVPIAYARALDLLAADDEELLMEQVVGVYQQALQDYGTDFDPRLSPDVIIVEGIAPCRDSNAAESINALMAKSLDADVILVATPLGQSLPELNETLVRAANDYGGTRSSRVLGAVLNMVNAPTDRSGLLRIELLNPVQRPHLDRDSIAQACPVFQQPGFHLIGAIPWEVEQTASRTRDLFDYLQVSLINEGELDSRRIKHVMVAAQSVAGFMEQIRSGVLVFTPHDRDDIISAVALACGNGIDIAGLVLTGSGASNSRTPSPKALAWCQSALKSGLPVAATELDIYHATTLLPRYDNKVHVDDHERIELIMNRVAHFVDNHWLEQQLATTRTRLLTPAAFRYDLVQRARNANKTIVLPEGEEPRTIRAAAICAQRHIAKTILLGDPRVIAQVAEAQGVTLGEGIEIRHPEQFRAHYVADLLARRKHKGLSEERAAQALEDNVVLGTMMVVHDEVDGLVSGAIHTTANTIRPALQLIRTRESARLVSSVFFMCLPDQVLVYGDCAINPDPTAEELADIAIQSARSAQAFGIEPRVALISYSTGQSGQGSDVDKVRTATDIVKQRAPDLLVDGPLQYDAALIKSVARAKAPDSPVAGQANVIIFPDLNTGNTTYKAVQRSANVISIGPMLQGLRKPVNDLSRGALVDDIVYTIAITAIQASQRED